MKFSCSVEINLSKQKVAQLFIDDNNLKHWQDGFQSITLLSGEKSKTGATYLIKYDNGKRAFDLKETILVYNMPHKLLGKYEHKRMTNTMENIFETIHENQTRWTANLDYIEVKGAMKIFAWLFPSMFKKQTQKWLNQFKTFAENYQFNT